MHVNKTRALAGASMMSALSVVFLLLGTYISVNTLFFTALAAFLIGVSINQYGFRYGGIQFVVCLLLDVILNPDKFHAILYLCLGAYIFLSEVIFQKFNKIEEPGKKMRVQWGIQWVLFNVIYIPLLLFWGQLLFAGNLPGGIALHSVKGKLILWAAGQFGWIVYDKAYRAFFRFLRERRIK